MTMPRYEYETDTDVKVWKALADPHRRTMLDLLRQRPMTTGELAACFDFSRFGAMKHLDVLVEANLVQVRRSGKERWNSVNPVPLQQIYERWLKPFETVSVHALHRLKSLAEQSGTAMSMPASLTSYTLQLKIEVKASRKTVWQAMTRDIGKWWPRHFFSHSRAKTFVMECQVGGRVYEDWGGKSGGEWGRLIVFQPEEKIVWVGNHFGGGGRNWGHFFVTIVLKDHSKGIMLEFEDSGFGMLDENMRASLESGWQEVFGTHLREYCEAKKMKTAKKKR